MLSLFIVSGYSANKRYDNFSNNFDVNNLFPVFIIPYYCSNN